MNFYLSNKKQVEIEFKDIVYHDIKIMKYVGANLVKKTWKTCTVDPWTTCYPSPVEHLHTTLQLVLCIHDSLSVGSAKADCVSQLSHSVVSDSATPWTAACQASLSITNSRSPMSIESVMPSHLLSSPSPPALNLSQHQGLFQWVSSSYQVARVLEFQLQHQSFQWTPRTDLF